MPSLSNFFQDFFNLPIPHQEMSLKFHDILYSLSPIVDNPLYVDFMELTHENRTILIKLKMQFDVLFKSNYFIEDYLLKSPEMRVQFKQQFLEKKTELNFSEHTRSQFADLFDKHTNKEDFRNMQSAGLIGQLSHHPSKNEKLKKLIDDGGIDYSDILEEQTRTNELILSNASVANPIPCHYIKPCSENPSPGISYKICNSTLLEINNNTLRSDIACFILSNLTTDHDLTIRIECSQTPPLDGMLVYFIVKYYYRVNLRLSSSVSNYKISLQLFFKLCHFNIKTFKFKVEKFPIMDMDMSNSEILKRFLMFLKVNLEKVTHEGALENLKLVYNYISTTPTLLRFKINNLFDENDPNIILQFKDTLFCGINLYIDEKETKNVIYKQGNYKIACTFKKEHEQMGNIAKKHIKN